MPVLHSVSDQELGRSWLRLQTGKVVAKGIEGRGSVGGRVKDSVKDRRSRAGKRGPAAAAAAAAAVVGLMSIAVRTSGTSHCCSQ